MLRRKVIRQIALFVLWNNITCIHICATWGILSRLRRVSLGVHNEPFPFTCVHRVYDTSRSQPTKCWSQKLDTLVFRLRNNRGTNQPTLRCTKYLFLTGLTIASKVSCLYIYVLNISRPDDFSQGQRFKYLRRRCLSSATAGWPSRPSVLFISGIHPPFSSKFFFKFNCLLILVDLENSGLEHSQKKIVQRSSMDSDVDSPHLPHTSRRFFSFLPCFLYLEPRLRR